VCGYEVGELDYLNSYTGLYIS